jgi:glycosyltransferase involved in cell wall biosynthesis
VHQFRQAYELDGTDLGQFGDGVVDRATRRAIHRLDRIALGEARKRCTISRNVAERLQRNLGLDAEVVLPPPQNLDFRCDEYGDFILSVNRLDRAKRIDLLLEAAAGDPSTRVVIAGDGPDRERLERIAERNGLDGRATFAGRVSQAELADLYARCLAVYYAPVDEDYGMVPYEAFLSQKPVVTTTDAGGPLDVVSDRRTGLVVDPRTDAVAGAVRFLREHPDDARIWGRAGKEVAAQVTWDHAIARLLP